MFKPYYKIGKQGNSGQCLWTKKMGPWFVTVGTPKVLQEEPQHPHRITFSGYTFGLCGVNVSIL